MNKNFSFFIINISFQYSMKLIKIYLIFQKINKILLESSIKFSIITFNKLFYNNA